MIKAFLMRLARAVLQEVINQINQIVQETLDSVLNPIEAIAQEIGGGDSWRGDGANAFVEELNSILIPDVNQLTQSCVTGINSMNTAEQIMTEAENNARTMVDGWVDTVQAIC